MGSNTKLNEKKYKTRSREIQNPMEEKIDPNRGNTEHNRKIQNTIERNTELSGKEHRNK